MDRLLRPLLPSREVLAETRSSFEFARAGGLVALVDGGRQLQPCLEDLLFAVAAEQPPNAIEVEDRVDVPAEDCLRRLVRSPGAIAHGERGCLAMTVVVDRTSVREQVRRILHAQVLSGALVPGQVYSAVALAEELKVSATPVREAMLELANAGFVEVARNRGFRILTISDRDLDEIVELRLMLEVPAIKKVIASASDEQLALLGPLAVEIVEAARREDLPAYLLSDQTFHRTLLELAGNARLVKLVVDLRDQTRLLGLRGLSASGKLIESAEEHCEIASMIQARNLKQAQALMTRHIQHVRGIWAGVAEREDSQAAAA